MQRRVPEDIPPSILLDQTQCVVVPVPDTRTAACVRYFGPGIMTRRAGFWEREGTIHEPERKKRRAK
jgi:hypothetical protein